MPKAPTSELSLSLTLLAPPPGVLFSLQSGKSDFPQPKLSTGQDIAFHLSVQVRFANTVPHFSGPFTQGPPDKRFIYICSGTCAGQKNSPWTRRAIIRLPAIPTDLIRKALKQHGTSLHASFPGTAKDTGPTCATVPIPKAAWRLIEQTPATPAT